MTSLTLIALAAVSTPQAGSEMRLMRFPAVHGDTIVFTYASDLWVADKDGGFARRLTSHPADETRARISPDGKWVAFSASYDGNPDVYVVSIEGGEPKRLTFDPNGDAVINWTPDGKIAYISSTGNFTNRQQRLWLVDPKGGLPTPTVLDEVSDGSYFPGSRKFAYNRVNSHAQNWRRYRGGRNGKISIFDFSDNSYSELPNKGENSWFPMVVGDDIYYISDRNQGTVNLYRYGTSTKQEAQVTRFDDADMKWPATDGKTIVFERDGYLYKFDVASGNSRRLNFQVRSDALSTRPYIRRVGNEISGVSLSPSGVRLAVEAHGDIFSVPAKQGDTRNLTSSSGARDRLPEWSPDGKVIAFISDRSGEYQIYTMPPTGGEPTQVSNHPKMRITGFSWSPDSKSIAYTTDAYELFLLDPATKVSKLVYKSDYGTSGDYDWAPDSKWIAYIDTGKNGFGKLTLYNIASGKATHVSEGYYDDRNVSFDQSGKYLYFSSARTFSPAPGRFELTLRVDRADRIYVLPLSKDTPNPLTTSSDEEPVPGGGGTPAGPPSNIVKVDFENIETRAIVLPMQADDVPFVLGSNEGVFFFANGAINKFDLQSRAVTPIFAGLGNFAVNASRTKYAYYAGGVLGVLNVQAGGVPGGGRVDTSNMDMTVDPRAEWKQIFWESWRLQRDNFYDADMLGLDWNAIGRHYEQYLQHVKHRSELTYVIGLMIGELGTSHSYVQNPPGGGGDGASAAMLGADYEVSGNNIRFKKVYRGTSSIEDRRGPLAEPGVDVKDGEYLLAIDGTPVTASTNPGSLLVGKSGRYTTLTINSTPTMTGARKVRVRPVGNEANLRYHEWVEETRKKVAQMSGGRIGYIHYPSTGTDGQVEFIRGYWAQTDKEALILDGRWNSGGFIQPMVVPTVGRTSQAIIQSRHNVDGPEVAAIDGPKVMLTNYYAGSGGDFTPWLFQNAGYGPVIGTRTLGGLVGIQGFYGLMDGGTVSSPEFAFYDPKTGVWIAENKGVTPDIIVDRTAEDVARGRDAQLEKAVQVLLEELKKKPAGAKREDFPRVRKGGG